jgi:prepilin peptidase CpaA
MHPDMPPAYSLSDGIPLSLVILASLVLVASLLDLLWRRIPNWLTVTAALTGLVLGFWEGGTAGLVTSILGLLLGFALLLPGYLLHMTGGGDLKLMAAVGSLLGPILILYAFLLYILAGLAWALIYGLYAWAARGAEPPLGRYWAMLRTLLRTGRVAYVRPKPNEAMGRRLPMAPAIAFGALAAPLLFAT